MSLDGKPVTILVNASARRAHPREWRSARGVLEASCDTTVAVPGSAREMVAAAGEAASRGAAAVVVVGGDGSVNCVAAALAGTATPMGILPLGTGNDFARAMGLPGDAVAAAGRIVEGRQVRVDLVSANGRLFCTAGLLGVPADAALTVRRWFAPGARTRPLIHVFRGASYRLAGLRHLLRIRGTTRGYEIRPATGAGPDAAPVTRRAHGIFIANTPTLGGGLILPVPADPCDGRMEIVVIRDVPRLALLWAFVCFSAGWRVPAGVLEVIRCAGATIGCDDVEPFAADGDLAGEERVFSFAVSPQALRVIR